MRLVETGKPLPSSIATLSPAPERPLLSTNWSFDLGRERPLLSTNWSDDLQTEATASPTDDESDVRVMSCLVDDEDDAAEIEARLLTEASGELKETYKRQGELGLYAKFMRVAGRIGLLVFFLLLTTFVVALTYPRESPSSTFLFVWSGLTRHLQR